MKIDPKAINELVSSTLFHQHKHGLTSTNYCSWEGVGRLLELMADDAWYCNLVYAANTTAWFVEFARPVLALGETRRNAKVEAIASTTQLDDVPTLVALTFLCTHTSVSPERLAETYGFQIVSRDGVSVEIKID